MHGNELSKTSFGDTPVASIEEDTTDDRKELERWASAIAGCLQQAVLVPPTPIGLGQASSAIEVPAGWRPSVESLTPEIASHGSAMAVASGDSSGSVAEESSNQQVQVRVTTKDFGEIALVVERAPAGLRVLVGAMDPRAVAALTADGPLVRRALESGGQSVGSLEFVRMDSLGTNLAQTNHAASPRARRSQESAKSNPELGPRKKHSKRLDLIG